MYFAYLLLQVPRKRPSYKDIPKESHAKGGTQDPYAFYLYIKSFLGFCNNKYEKHKRFFEIPNNCISQMQKYNNNFKKLLTLISFLVK